MLSKHDIFKIKTNEDFEAMALKVFSYQIKHCKTYKQYINLLGINASSIQNIEDIPFLPIRFFKSNTIYSTNKPNNIVFTSSGTTGMQASKHYVADVSLYKKSFTEGFSAFYGNPKQYAILALLPAYLEREGSSLIYMIDNLIKMSDYPQSGFFLHNKQDLYNSLNLLQKKQIPTLLIGVSFALLDFVEQFKINFPELIVMETGGMKGRRRELPREELHNILCHGFGVTKIHSEYGMTELLSQAYSNGNGLFKTPPWAKVLIRNIQNPLLINRKQITGGINIIDLANIYSCSFIETQDLGKIHLNNSFEIQGRFDESDIRGCNLMVVD